MNTSKNKILIYPYQIYSESARALQDELISRNISCKRCRKDRDYIIGRYSTIVNWGNGEWPQWLSTKRDIINPPHKVKDASNKITTFQLLQGKVAMPQFTIEKSEANTWRTRGSAILARTKINGSGGEGIIVVEPTDQLPDAPLYVMYIKKKFEFRVHVFMGEVIDIQHKKRDLSVDIVNNKIRSHSNGWVFTRNDLPPLAIDYRLSRAAITAVRLLQLDFGAVDVIYNSDLDMFYVLEVNTAPGLEGQTVKIYAEKIIKRCVDAQLARYLV